MDISRSPDPADDDGHRRQGTRPLPGRSPSPGAPAPEPDDGGSGENKQPSRVEEGRTVGKATMEPSPSPDSTISSHHEGRQQVLLSSPPATPVPDPEDGGGSGSDDLMRAEGGRVVGKDITTAATKVSSPSPDSTISSHHDGRHQVVLSSPPGTPAPDTEDGGSNNLSLAVSLLSLTEAGLTPGKAGSAPSVVDHSPSPPDSAFPIHDDVTGENKWTHVRFLVSHAEAGLIIGTGGSAVATVEARSGARIKLSRHDELLPGTDRRVELVSGLLSQVMDAMELLLEKLLYQGDQVVDSQPTIVLMVPQPCCGVLIGKGGSVIKSLTEVSEAVLQISPQNISYGLNDRLVTITGPLDSQLRAVFLIIFELLEDARYSFAYATATPNTPMRSPVNKDAQESLTIAVADEYMGAVIGRAGRIINETSKVSGACIDISAKGEFIPGTRDREVSISGTSEAIRAAEVMIMHRVSVANGDGGKFTRRRVEGSGKGLLTRLDEEADAIMQMHQLNLSDESVIQ